MSDKGFIVIDRCLEDWQYADVETACYLWLRILLRANWKDGWFMGTPIPRGSFATSIGNFAGELNLHPNTVRKWLKRFEEAGQIEVKSTNRFTLIKVINYAKYQDIPDDRVKQDVNQDVKQDVEQRVNQDVNQDVKQRVDNRTIETKKPSNKETKKQVYRGFTPPTLDEVSEYVNENYFLVDPEKFHDYYQQQNWRLSNGQKMADWKAAVRNWNRREQKESKKGELPF